jgi:hypothetical protein
MDIRHAVGVTRGVPSEKLADVLTYRESPRFSEREWAALQFCERITRDDLEVSEECLAQVREHFTEAESVEPTFIIGFQTFDRNLRRTWGLAPQGYSSSSVSVTSRIDAKGWARTFLGGKSCG